LKTHERDAIPKEFPKGKAFGMTQLSLTVSSNSPENFENERLFKLKAFLKVENA
jgi:hypothetical protein